MTDVRECSVDECETTKIFSAGMCSSHYKKWWKANRAKPCSIEGCKNPSDTKGWCATHHKRWKLFGDPLYVAPPKEPQFCSLEDCSRPFYGVGLCEVHYARKRRHGGLQDKRAETSDPIERFWSKVQIGDSCWLWTDGVNGSGYGTFGTTEGHFGAHVYSVMIDGREVPAGMHIDHLCMVRACVNPAHLEVVTPAENNRRMQLAKRKRKDGELDRVRRESLGGRGIEAEGSEVA